MSIDVYEIRSRYTTPNNACKPDEIQRLAPIAIAHDVASLVGEIETLRSRVSKLEAELRSTTK
jgi:hypothetical protein